MSMLNFFKKTADSMRREPSALDRRLDALDAKYGTNTLAFMQSNSAPVQAAEMIDSARLMSQTDNAAGVVNPAALRLESNAVAAPVAALPLFDPRSNNRSGGALEDPNAETDQERRLRESYEILQTTPLRDSVDIQPYGATQPLNIYG